MFSQGRIEILDHLQLIRELQCLERRTRAGGKDIVDHPRGGHDDYANVLALAAVSAVSAATYEPGGTEVVWASDGALELFGELEYDAEGWLQRGL